MGDEAMGDGVLRLPLDSLVVLAGPSGAGKSTWAREWFRPNQIVSSDSLRAVVGEHEADQRAGGDAFDVLDVIVERRLARGLLTVVDTLGMDAERRGRWLHQARTAGRAAHAVVFDVDARTCRTRNKARTHPVPAKVLTGQLDRWAAVRGGLEAEGFDGVHPAGPVAIVPDPFLRSGALAAHQRAEPAHLSFGLQVSRFDVGDDESTHAERLGEIAAEAERAGFTSLWVMDHFVQIPQVGREWEPMLESYTTLGFLAGRTSTLQLGTLVTGVTYRNIAHLAKVVATLDVLSEGRAACGIGAAWFEREHHAYGYRFPPIAERYELLEDALRLLPLMWGPGSPEFTGHHISTPEAICYPRPVSDRIPVLVGGSGERRTLRLVAQYADACNLFGDPDTVRRKVDVLHRHCADVGRDPAEIRVTQLSAALVAPDRERLDQRIDELRGDRLSPEELARRANAGTVDDHIGRFRALADAGVQTAIVSLRDSGIRGSIERFADVIDAFRPRERPPA